MTIDQPKPYWIDCLRRKHECWPYGDGRDLGEVRIQHNGQPVRLVMPEWLTEVEPLTTCGVGDLLFILARPKESHYEAGTVILMVARCDREEENVWSVVVWHELYEWALVFLGLAEAKSVD